MNYVNLGKSGLKISRLALGCMTYGDPKAGTHDWALGLDDARPFIRQAIEAGINFFDTADAYSAGASEEVVGQLLKEHASREDVVIATKVHFPVGKGGPNRQGLSRKALIAACEASLKRLGTDYIDLYQIHRWDPATPIEETLQTLDDLIRAGKVRYIGASSMYAWQFSKALYTSKLNGWAQFASMQPHYNLLYREEEREIIPLCQDQGVAVIPWSPLARGRLTKITTESDRSRHDPFAKSLYLDEDEKIIEVVARIAKARDVPMAQIALAWTSSRPGITAPIIGATKPHHITDAVAALNISLTEEEIAEMERFYTPRAVSGLSR
ncbi:aldo/keto reductase [Ochrobactrum sp. CM-21-5]|nr:aldo/keto reductase [Ochrobactrum sp. CM-21-5]MBC2887474.1 aldo/keto reductase [Ochrobactrum sp. CM-21-5]